MLPRSGNAGARLLSGLALAIYCTASAIPACSQSDGGDLAHSYWSALSIDGRQLPLVSAEVPVFGCPVSGMADDLPPPKARPSIRVLIPQGTSASLAYFTTTEDASRGVLAPKAWSCHGQSGSDGDVLYVVPADAVLDQENGGYRGPMIRRRVAEGSTSGRFEVARVAGRIFPQARRFAESVRAEGMDEPGAYAFTPWPADHVQRLADAVAVYTTPGGAQGLGRQDKPPYGTDATSGVVVFGSSLEGDPFLLQLDVRPGGDADLTSAAIVTAFLARLVVPNTPQPARPTVRAADGPKADAVVRAFYEALGRADGKAASALVVPERRTSGPYASEAITRFYASLAEPLRLTAIEVSNGAEVEVAYRYRKGSGTQCNGRAVVATRPVGGTTLITRIRPLNGC